MTICRTRPKYLDGVDILNIINDLIESEMTGKIFSINGSEIGYWQEPTFHKL